MTKLSETLSLQQAQKLILLSQQVPSPKQTGRAINATLSAIMHLGYIQIDTISVIQRAHHHVLWSRNPRYNISHLDTLVEQKKVFEYWSHAAAYLPMNDYRFSLYRKQAIANGEQKHWYERDHKLMNSVLKRIETEGSLMAKDFEYTGKKKWEWGSKPAKRALENLFMQGELMISERKNFHKVYDLTERVLPHDINKTIPTQEEYIRFLITSFLRANGIGQASEMSYLLQNTRSLVSSALHEMYLRSELIQVKVNGINYFTMPKSLELLNKPLSRSKLKILSPFDNLLIQRKRMQNLFNFDYQIECYVPESKRKFGYFSLPILWGGKLVARMDCKADRKTSVLHINHLALEPGFKETEAFAIALRKELESFVVFNDSKELCLHRTTPTGFKDILSLSKYM